MAGNRAGARLSRTGLADLLRSWARHHRLSARDSLQRLLLSPLSSLLTWLVIAIALSLPVGMSVALDNALQLSQGWDSPAQISLFLRAEMSLEAAQQFERQLALRHDVAETLFISRSEALREFQQLSGFGDVLRNLDDNPLPNLIIVAPGATTRSAELAANLRDQLQALPEVDRAVLDMEWVQRLNALMALSQRIVAALGLLLGLGVLLVIGNTIRLAIENRRDEIIIVKLVGGSNAFVRRPFLYTGLWYGLGGSMLAWLIIFTALWSLREPMQALAALYNSGFQIHGLGLRGTAQLLLGGSLMGLVGAWIAVAQHLRAIEPR